jgi:hypothetical protein
LHGTLHGQSSAGPNQSLVWRDVSVHALLVLD